jgi:hypothetical protein
VTPATRRAPIRAAGACYSRCIFRIHSLVQLFADLLAAIRAGTTYVNVHTTAFPGGEIRGQLARAN